MGRRNGYGSAALVLGVLALLLSWTVAGGVLLGLAAVVLGALGLGRVRRGEASNRVAATAGVVLGVVGAVVGVAVLVLAFLFVRSDNGRAYVDCLEDAGSVQRAEVCADVLQR